MSSSVADHPRTRGVIIRADYDTLIVQADADDVRRYSQGAGVTVVATGRQTMSLAAAKSLIEGRAVVNWRAVRPGMNLYDAQGNHFAVMTEFNLTSASAGMSSTPMGLQGEIRAVVVTDYFA